MFKEGPDNKTDSLLPPPADLPELEEVDQPKEVEAHAETVAKYVLFKDQLKPKDDVIYHPCGAYDVSPSTAFPNSRVVYADIDIKAVNALKQAGFEAHAASALEFNLGEVDILILRNPQISPTVPASHVREDGYVLSNDYHGTATALNSDGQFQLQALIRTTPDNELLFDTENLDDCWQEIDSDKEFMSSPFIWGTANYRSAAKAVKAVTGKEENVLSEYKKIIEVALEQRRQQNAQDLAEHPEWAETMTNSDDPDTLVYNYGGQQFMLINIFPRKKGTADDVFVFQKQKSLDTNPAPTNTEPSQQP